MSEISETKFLKHDTQWINQIQSYEKLVDDEEKKIDVGKGVKLGWIKGVLIPCLLSIWGVMLFLRLPWIVGQAGIRDSIIIILISLTIILITTFSLSAISTNGRISGGGLYFIISRSIGPEFGSSIGILLALANIISSAINTIGFCLSLNLLLKSYDIYIMDNEFGFKAVGISLIILMGINCAIGMDREAIVQDILLFAIIIGIFNVYIGSIRGPTNITAKASGFTGYNMETFMKNWYPDYRMENHIKLSFFAVFSIFFPSVTGIQAGANISGDLKDPSASIPKGTLLSIFITIMSYIMLVLVIGSVHLREASGIPEELFNGTYLNCSTSLVPACKEGLYSNVKLMQTISYWPVLIYLGTFGATISTALTALISVPKILQRMGQDQVYPLLKYLAKGYGITNEPYHAHIFAVLLTSTFFMISELNKAASFMSTIYLCAYALLNLSTFHVAHFNHVGWRPTYKFYNKWLSLAGSIICLSVMISIDPSMSMFVFVGIWILYKIASRKKEEVNWGSSMKIQRYKSILKNLRNVYIIKYHAKNYLTNITVLSGEPNLRKRLISLGHLIANKNGLLVCINVEKEKLSHKERQVILDKGIEWLKSCKLNCLYNVLDSVKLDEAVRMTYMCGHGQLRPNIVLVGYKTDWLDSSDNELHSYLNVFNEASLNEISTLMVRYPSIVRNNSMPKKNCPRQISPIENRIEHFVNIHTSSFLFIDYQPKSTVDVWWLFDDGGLSLTVAYLIKSSIFWKDCKFRIFGVAEAINMEIEKKKLKELLTMFRVNFDFVEIIEAKSTSNSTLLYFSSLLKRINENELYNHRFSIENTSKTLFVRDLIEIHSMEATLIILSVPKPIMEFNIIHMCWIDTITRVLPLCILVNGNDIPTITAYA